MSAPDPRSDPVLARRARIAQAVKIGQRIGYLLFSVAVVLFFIGFAVGFGEVIVTLIEVSLLVGSLVLAPSIVLSYGVKAAEKDERGEHPG